MSPIILSILKNNNIIVFAIKSVFSGFEIKVFIKPSITFSSFVKMSETAEKQIKNSVIEIIKLKIKKII